MASISVDIDLDEFDLSEILEEIEDRYAYSNRNKKEIDEWSESFFSLETNIKFSLVDQMKIDFLMHNLDRIKLNDLENLI